jgi:hypothetical protein
MTLPVTVHADGLVELSSISQSVFDNDPMVSYDGTMIYI